MENEEYHFGKELTVEVLEGVVISLNGLVIVEEVGNNARVECAE